MLKLISFAGSLALCSTAFAADIINKDTKTYTLDITCDGATTHATLGANTTQSDAISKGCVLKINSSNTAYTVQTDKNVVIKGGKAHEDEPQKG